MTKPVQQNDVVEMRQALASAADTKLAHVVNYLDALPSRETAEAFLAPLRPRLRQLQVRRRIGLGRLIVMPFEILVVDPRGWKPGAHAIPRHALKSMLQAILPTIGDRRDVLDTALRQMETDSGAMLAVGCEVWPLAAHALETAPPAPDIPAGEYARMTRMARAVLAQARQIETEAKRACVCAEIDMPLVLGILRSAAEFGPEGFAAVLAVLLVKLPMADGLLAMADEAGSGNPALRSAAQDVLSSLLERAVAAPPPVDNLSRAAAETERTATLLEQLEAQPRRSAALGAQIAEVRQVTVQASRASMDHAATVTLPRLAEAATTHPDSIDDLERSARDLKRLAQVTRRLGPRLATDDVLRNAANATLEKARALDVADRARLVELLCGADEALALLERETTF